MGQKRLSFLGEICGNVVHTVVAFVSMWMVLVLTVYNSLVMLLFSTMWVRFYTTWFGAILMVFIADLAALYCQ